MKMDTRGTHSGGGKHIWEKMKCEEGGKGIRLKKKKQEDGKGKKILRREV